jgi:hypothetical protein
VTVAGIILLLWRGLSGSAAEMQRYVTPSQEKTVLRASSRLALILQSRLVIQAYRYQIQSRILTRAWFHSQVRLLGSS